MRRICADCSKEKPPEGVFFNSIQMIADQVAINALFEFRQQPRGARSRRHQSAIPFNRLGKPFSDRLQTVRRLQSCSQSGTNAANEMSDD
jgi:hypothetical protein